MISDKEMQQLGEGFNKTQLEGSLYVFAKKFYMKYLWDIDKVLPGYKHAKFAVEKLKEKKIPVKADLNIICFSVFEDEKIYTLFRKTLPTYIQKLVEILIWREAISHQEAEKLLDMNLLDDEINRYAGQNLKKDFFFFMVDTFSEWTAKGQIKSYVLSIPKPIRAILVEYYPKPPYYYFTPINTSPEGCTIFNAEAQIMLELPAILSYHLQAMVKYTNSGRPNEVSVNKMQRLCNLTEFYQDEWLKNIRTMMIAGMLNGLKVKGINTANADLLKTIFTEHYKTIYTPQFILTQFKGWAYIDKYYLKDESFELMLDTFKQLPQHGWITIENLLGYINSRVIEVRGVQSGLVNNYLKLNDNFTNTDQYYPKNITVGNLVKIPYIKGCVFLFAAFGLMEIAYTGINPKKFGETHYSPIDGLKYFRLTALGAYVLGLNQSYEPQHAASQNKLHFNEDSMGITAEGNLKVIDVMLARFAEKEGSGRYRVVPSVFFKDCKSSKDIDAKILTFKKTVSAELPRHWLAIFAEWQANAQSIKNDTNKLVYSIPAKATELQKLIAKDALLKTIVLKAEGFNVVIDKDDDAKFKQRMKELGYFVA